MTQAFKSVLNLCLNSRCMRIPWVRLHLCISSCGNWTEGSTAHAIVYTSVVCSTTVQLYTSIVNRGDLNLDNEGCHLAISWSHDHMFEIEKAFFWNLQLTRFERMSSQQRLGYYSKTNKIKMNLRHTSLVEVNERCVYQQHCTHGNCDIFNFWYMFDFFHLFKTRFLLFYGGVFFSLFYGGVLIIALWLF